MSILEATEWGWIRVHKPLEKKKRTAWQNSEWQHPGQDLESTERHTSQAKIIALIQKKSISHQAI